MRFYKNIGSLLCPICGGAQARANYNGLSCTSCKSFFIRTTLNFYPYECPRNDDCRIVPNELSNCKACRYRKCLATGMDPNLVCRKPKYVESVGNLSFGNKAQLIQKHVMPMLSLGFHFVAGATCYMGPAQFARYFLGVDKASINNVSTEDPNLAIANLNVSLADVFLNSAICYTHEEDMPTSPGEIAGRIFPRGLCKFLTSFVDFATAVPEIRYLSTADTMRLVQNNRLCAVTLRSFYFNHLEADRSENEAKSALQVEILSKEHAAMLKKFHLFYSEKAVKFLDRVKMTEEEMILLRLIAVVAPFPNVSEPGSEFLRNARGKYINILIEYQKERYPEMSECDKIKRLRIMLNFLAKLKEFSNEMNRDTTALVLNNVNHVLGPLSFDLQIREYTD